jgi:hypothetical protein
MQVADLPVQWLHFRLTHHKNRPVNSTGQRDCEWHRRNLPSLLRKHH